VTEDEAVTYAAHLADHVREGDVAERRRFLAAFVRRIVVYDHDGVIELTDDPALSALRSSATRVARDVARAKNVPLDGTPDGIRTRDLHLERVMS
jgi:hypothetical protein